MDPAKISIPRTANRKMKRNIRIRIDVTDLKKGSNVAVVSLVQKRFLIFVCESEVAGDVDVVVVKACASGHLDTIHRST